jgi:23S rRNA (cytidine1920-2'-O)/16S rRNA (cytidine1409-2'-O)-methyltransferase
LKRRLDVRVAELGHSREHAQRLIMAGLVQVDGRRMDKPGTTISDDARVEVLRPLHPYVGRGGLKLERALDEWHMDVSDKVALDMGASTGGFTHCMLLRGARKVYAVDVGYGQLDYRLRQDTRVVSIERLNAREMTAEHVPELVDIATIDVSFISLRLVLPPVLERIRPGGDCVALVKPQFEAGRGQVGRGGVVRDPAVHRAVLERFVSESPWPVHGLTRSPIEGATGNVEFLAWLRREAPAGEMALAIPDLVRGRQETLAEGGE